MPCRGRQPKSRLHAAPCGPPTPELRAPTQQQTTNYFQLSLLGCSRGHSMRQSTSLLFRACQVLETVKKTTGGRCVRHRRLSRPPCSARSRFPCLGTLRGSYSPGSSSLVRCMIKCIIGPLTVDTRPPPPPPLPAGPGKSRGASAASARRRPATG